MLNLADPALSLTASSTSGDAFVSLCDASTPLYRVVLIRKSFWGKLRAQLLAVDADVDTSEAFTDDPFTDDV